MARGRLGDAVATTIKGSRQPRSMAWMPRAVLAPLLSAPIRFEKVSGDDVALRDLLLTIPHEIALVKGTDGTLGDYRAVAADVLLLHGRRTDAMFVDTARALKGVHPRATCISVPGLDHRSAQNYGSRPDRAAARTLLPSPGLRRRDSNLNRRNQNHSGRIQMGLLLSSPPRACPISGRCRVQAVLRPSEASAAGPA